MTELNGVTRRQLVGGAAVAVVAAGAGVAIDRVLGAGRHSLEPAHPFLEPVGVAAPGTGFAGIVSGERFVPWGFNWGGPGQYRDLAIVQKRFAEMRSLGANTVRVHLQFGDLMESPTRASNQELGHLARIVEIAEQERLYLDISGNEVWLPARAPSWYSRLGESERWQAQAAYWAAVARVCAPSPAVFCYDLLSEPFVGSALPPGDWYTAKLGGYYFGQRISLDLAGRSRDDVAKAWTAELTSAIRAHDRSHMITVGMVPEMEVSGFRADAVAPLLDFLSVHVYPRSGRATESIALVEQLSAIGKPVLIEETFVFMGDVDTLEAFIRGTRSAAAGWLGFYFPQWLGRQSSLQSVLANEWVNLFRKYTPVLARAPGSGFASAP